MFKSWQLDQAKRKIKSLTEQNKQMEIAIEGLERENKLLRNKLLEFDKAKEEVEHIVEETQGYLKSARNTKEEYERAMKEFVLQRQNYEKQIAELLDDLKRNKK